LFIALRSQYEVVTIIKLAHRLRYLDAAVTKELEIEIAEIGKLLQALINSLQTKSNNQQLKTDYGYGLWTLDFRLWTIDIRL
jgi:hypothetical protein